MPSVFDLVDAVEADLTARDAAAQADAETRRLEALAARLQQVTEEYGTADDRLMLAIAKACKRALPRTPDGKPDVDNYDPKFAPILYKLLLMFADDPAQFWYEPAPAAPAPQAKQQERPAQPARVANETPRPNPAPPAESSRRRVRPAPAAPAPQAKQQERPAQPARVANETPRRAVVTDPDDQEAQLVDAAAAARPVPTTDPHDLFKPAFSGLNPDGEPPAAPARKLVAVGASTRVDPAHAVTQPIQQVNGNGSPRQTPKSRRNAMSV